MLKIVARKDLEVVNANKLFKKYKVFGTSLAVQRLGVCLPMQGTWVQIPSPGGSYMPQSS